ncbi:accessory gene regulator B family protein [Sedimentibacter hydroxybenzoicus DSM 7310]|uniref:Accessory gene regulator B family protein n=1 Tax=Sedimentibacter hydroxybenzoicus DSM 7310 TaxID=1123245 RepID=A0A974BLH2_SEDHY|nr:accessory gene regulator B family protein [Sedimentibacter hydroxybenzoicus]NYB75554.1 accessory gene regulator B family protein [Sedimentibacter hydroxybenzoicus DSM 7310]
MIDYLSCSIADYFCANKIIYDSEKKIYIYGLRLIMSTLVSILAIIGISILINEKLITAIFLSVFITIRRYSGGYHASTYFRCILTFILLYLAIISIILFTNHDYIIIISCVTAITAIFIFLKYSPVDNENKKLTTHQKIKNKKISLYLLFALYAFSIPFIGVNIRLFYTVAITLFMVSMLILIQVKGGRKI